MKKRPSITLLTVLLTMVFAAGIGVYSSYIGMKIYQESSDHLLESFSQISETFTLFVQRNWTVLRQWDGLLKNADIDHAGSIGADMQANKESWHYSDFYLFNESTQYLTADGRRGSADSISGVFQEMYSEGGPIVSTYTASYGVPKIVFAMPLSRNMTLDGVTYTGLAVSYDTDVVDDLVDGSMYGGQSDCYIVRANGDIVLALEPQTELCKGLTNLYDLDAHAEWRYGSMDDIRDRVRLGRSGSAQFTCQGGRNYLVAIPTAFPDWTLVGIIRAGKAGCRDAVLTYIRLEGLNERNDRFGLQAGDESVIAAAQCVADFCRACEEAGESVLCFRTGGNEFALIRPEPHTDSGQLHRQFRAVVARYNRTCAPRARIIMTFGFSRLCDEDGKSRSISAWKAEADAHLKRNEAGLGGDAE